MQNFYRSLVWVLLLVLNGFMVSPSSACSTDSDCPPCQTCTFQVWSTKWNATSAECNEMYEYGGGGAFPYFCAAGNRCGNGPNYAQCEQKIAKSVYDNAFNAISTDAANYGNGINSNGVCSSPWNASISSGSPCETLLSTLAHYSAVSGQSPGTIMCNSLGATDPTCATNTPSKSIFCDGFCDPNPPPPSSNATSVAPEDIKTMVRFEVMSPRRHRVRWTNPEDRFSYHPQHHRVSRQFYVHRENMPRRENKPLCSSEKSKSPVCVIYKRDHKNR